jgi:two-component system, sensor histidine kinase PdtaS
LLRIGLIGALVIIGLGYYVLDIKKKSNKLLEEKNKAISKALEEKDILLREIHHRVKNNLQMISALLYLHGKSVDDTSAQEALMESQNRVQSMAIIHQNLYQHENLLGVSIGEYLDKLINHLISAYNIESDRIAIVKKINVPQLDVDTVIPMALIINELISNALKYAFRDGRKGEIQVTISQQNGLISVAVNDNGMGLPDHFTVESSSNFGLKLINILCDRLGATWSAQSRYGTQISIQIPYQKAA